MKGNKCDTERQWIVSVTCTWSVKAFFFCSLSLCGKYAGIEAQDLLKLLKANYSIYWHEGIEESEFEADFFPPCTWWIIGVYSADRIFPVDITQAISSSPLLVIDCCYDHNISYSCMRLKFYSEFDREEKGVIYQFSQTSKSPILYLFIFFWNSFWPCNSSSGLLKFFISSSPMVFMLSHS